MKAQNPSTSLGEGRDVTPSLAHPSQKQNLVVYTEELTHLDLALIYLQQWVTRDYTQQPIVMNLQPQRSPFLLFSSYTLPSHIRHNKRQEIKIKQIPMWSEPSIKEPNTRQQQRRHGEYPQQHLFPD
jgi:hypothetical protein